MAEAPNEGLFVGIVGADTEMFKTCAAALRPIASVVPLTVGVRDSVVGIAPGQRAPEELWEVDALLIAVGRSLPEEIARVAWCNATNPTVPLIVVATGVDADLAVELVKCGAHDFVSAPLIPNVLRFKVERAIGARSGPVLETPVLAPLDRSRSGREYDGANARRCFRARPILGRNVSVTVRLPNGSDQAFAVEDLSIATDGWPGGMLLRTERMPRQLPFADWSTRGLAMRIRLPDGKTEPIVASGRMLPGTRRTTRAGLLRFAIQYALQNAIDAARVQSYWIECQHRRLAPP